MIELILFGGLLWWFGKKGKEAIEDATVSDTEFRLAKLAEKHRIPYEASDGTRFTWDEPEPERPEIRLEIHDHRSIHQHVHFHFEQDDEA